jgi:hypothetical protein
VAKVALVVESSCEGLRREGVILFPSLILTSLKRFRFLYMGTGRERDVWMVASKRQVKEDGFQIERRIE